MWWFFFCLRGLSQCFRTWKTTLSVAPNCSMLQNRPPNGSEAENLLFQHPILVHSFVAKESLSPGFLIIQIVTWSWTIVLSRWVLRSTKGSDDNNTFNYVVVHFRNNSHISVFLTSLFSLNTLMMSSLWPKGTQATPFKLTDSPGARRD